MNDAPVSTLARVRRWASHATEPQILYPAIATLMLAVIWGLTLNLIAVERNAAENAAAVSSRELLETYEAQVVRALREIDQALKLVTYAYERGGKQGILQDLKARALLPPDMLFVVSIVDGMGEVVATTRPSATRNVANEDYFQSQRHTDALVVGLPEQTQGSREWRLQFSRRLDPGKPGFSGIVLVSVEASYFVSGYEVSKLGMQGMLGILGTDGVFRVRRSGETVTAGDHVNYAAVVPAVNETEIPAPLSMNPWDGVRRYTSARQLYDFPLAVIVGLSANEQLAATRLNMRAYVWRAAGGSVLMLLIVWVLFRLSRQLAQSRQRAVADQIAYAAQVEYLAYHDSLTSLPNRSLFTKLLEQSIHQAKRYQRRLAVLFLDLDHFKEINDTLGHESGDTLLREVAIRLKSGLRDSDTIARLGGDEFVVLLPELSEEMYATIVARKILAVVAQPFILLDQEFRVTASVGISIYPEDGLDEQTLTKNADVAMYKAKEEGKNNFQFYSEKLNSDSLERLTLEAGLRHALERNEFRLHYQAKREISSGRITGVEALLRWQHPDLGLVAPMRFIKVAEETGLIVPIGKWVLGTACAQNVAWNKQGLPRLNMAVNLTLRQFFDEHLETDLAAILSATGMDARLLELEIAESLLMRDVDKTLRILTGVKAMGIRMAIDDFGSGYCSLAKLGNFPLDTIKIDRSFIRDLTTGGKEKDLTEAIIAMGRTLSMTVVAQGVETKEQADILRLNACDEFQGFYFNKPLPADQVTDLLRAQANVAGAVTGPADDA
jgi:diguanylate cyclase (GGDEF)-like protein